jgi:hypothetical protein
VPKLSERATMSTTIPCCTCARLVPVGEACRYVFPFFLTWLLTGDCNTCQVSRG